MKTYYLVAILFSIGIVSANAQFPIDNMESYGGGNAPINTGHWSSWDGTDALAMLSSDAQARSGNLSGYIDGSTTMDPLLLLGDKIFGAWSLKFSLYIPSGKTGYFNLQGQEAPGIQWIVGNITLGNGDPVDDEFTGRIDMNTAGLTDDFVFQFPKDVWFDVIMNFDFNAGASASTWTMWVHDGIVYQNVVPVGTDFADGNGEFAQALGAINLYSFAPTNEMYIDDVQYINGPLIGLNDLKTVNFTVYPNPVDNVLNLQANEEITSAVVYNFLGQELYKVNFSALTATIDMSGFANGAYFVKVNAGGTEGILKVLKE